MPMNRFTGRPPMIAATVGTSRTWNACASCGLTLPSTTASTRRPPYDSTTGPRAELRPGAMNSTITGTRVESSTTLWNEASFVSKTSDEVARSEEHTSELQSRENLVCRLLLEKKKKE